MKKTFITFAAISLAAVLWTSGCQQLSSSNLMKGSFAMFEEKISLDTFNKPEIMMRKRPFFDTELLKQEVEKAKIATLNPFFPEDGPKDIGVINIFTRPDGVFAQLQEQINDYACWLKMKGSPFTYTSYYDANFNETSAIIDFYNVLIGTVIKFDKNGKIKEKKNAYGGHKITVEQLREIFKKEAGRDIYDPQQVFDFSKGSFPEINDGRPCYTLSLYALPLPSTELDMYFVDGITGKILFKGKGKIPRLLGYREAEEQRITNQYMRFLKEQEQQGKKQE